MDGSRGHAAGDFAGVVAAHAVSEYGQTDIGWVNTASSLCVRTMPGLLRLTI
jgi:hypothetical protein